MTDNLWYNIWTMIISYFYFLISFCCVQTQAWLIVIWPLKRKFHTNLSAEFINDNFSNKIWHIFAVINLHTNRCVRTIGKPENLRMIHLALFQGTGKKSKAAIDVEMAASDNPILQNITYDPILFCTGFKKNRFYMFSRREPEDRQR